MRVLTEQGDPNCRFSPFSRIFEEFGEIFKTFIAVLGKILIPLGQILMPRNKCRMLNKSIWSHWFEATFGIKSRKHFNKLFLRVSPQDTPILSVWVIYYLYFSSSSSLCRSKFVSFCFISNFYLFWLGHSQPLFSFFNAVCRKWNLPITGFKQRTNVVGSNFSTNSATTTGFPFYIRLLMRVSSVTRKNRQMSIKVAQKWVH